MHTSTGKFADIPQDRLAVATLHVDVIADFVCPWCFVGRRRLARALEAVHGPVDVNWFPSELNPNMPEGGLSLDHYLASRFGSPEIVAPGLDALRELGLSEGIRFDFGRIAKVPNTQDAHRLLYLAASAGVDAGRMADDLMSRFFERGEDLGATEVLVDAASGFGLSPVDIRAQLEDEGIRRVVREQQARLRQSGIDGVPAYLVNRRVLVSGAQAPDELVAVFDRAMFGVVAPDTPEATVH